MNQAAEKPVGFEGMNPILRVKDAQASANHYTGVLGFKIDFQLEGFVAVSRDKCHLFLCEGDQGHLGSWVYIGVEDVEALLKEYQQSGAKIRHLPTNYAWALEMQVEDLDGNVLRMGSEPREGEPLGEWLDMNGISWLPRAGGGWIRKE